MPRKKYMREEQSLVIRHLIYKAISQENPKDLRILTDVALGAICKRHGFNLTHQAIAHHRKAIGYPGAPARLRRLIGLSEGKK